MKQRSWHSLLVLVVLAALLSFSNTPHTTPAHAAASHSARAASPGAPIELLGSIGGRTNAMAVAGSVAYVNEGTRLSVVDLSNPAQPVRRGSVELLDLVVDIAVLDGMAYVALERQGLRIVDVSDPDRPALRGSYQPAGAPVQIEVQAGWAYLVLSQDYMESVLHMVDVSDPDNPRPLSTYHPSHAIYDLAVSGSFVYLMGGLEPVIQIVDVSNPVQPTLRSTYDTPGVPVDLSVVGTMIYIVDQVPGHTLLLLDATNPSAPVLRGSYSDPNASFDHVQVEGTTAYLFRYGGYEIRILDVSTPASPSVRASYFHPYQMFDLLIAGGRAYLTLNHEIALVDLTNPAQPVVRGTILLAQHIDSVQVIGNVAYASVSGNGLHIFDVSDPAHPTWHGIYRDDDIMIEPGFSNIQVQGNLAYVPTRRHVKIVDVSDPAHPTLDGEAEVPDPILHLYVAGNHVYVLSGITLYIFNISDSAHPTLRGTWTLPSGDTRDLQVVGNTAYIVTGFCMRQCNGWLYLVDVSNPSTPTLHSSLSIEYGSSVHVASGFAYVTGLGVKIIDVTDAGNPRLRSIYQTPRSATDVDIANNLMYVADGYRGGLHVADPTNPVYPRLRATYPLAGIANEVDAVDDMAYLADLAAGLRIFRVHPEQFPSSIFMPAIGK